MIIQCILILYIHNSNTDTWGLKKAGLLHPDCFHGLGAGGQRALVVPYRCSPLFSISPAAALLSGPLPPPSLSVTVPSSIPLNLRTDGRVVMTITII